MAKRKAEDFALHIGFTKNPKRRTNLRKHKGHKFLLSYVLPLVVYIGLMIYLASQQTSNLAGAAGIDLSFLHAIEFFVFSTLSLRILLHFKVENSLGMAILIALLAGIAMELYQATVPTRTASIIDVLYDGAGASLILLFLRFPRLLF